MGVYEDFSNMSVRDKVNAGYYETKRVYPGQRPKKPKLPDHPRDFAHLYKEADAAVMADYEARIAEWNEQNDRYMEDKNRLEDLFRKEAIEEVGMTGHPKADALYAKAYDDGHAYGFSEVIGKLDSYAELFDYGKFGRP